jgi:hypothetical protein
MLYDNIQKIFQPKHLITAPIAHLDKGLNVITVCLESRNCVFEVPDVHAHISMNVCTILYVRVNVMYMVCVRYIHC